jgi:hypothetical protein
VIKYNYQKKGKKTMKTIKTNTKVELSTEEVKALNDARIILADLQDLLDDGYNTLFTNKIEWEYGEIANAVTLLDELANDEITIVE